MGFEEVVDRPQFATQRLGAELAERVAEIEARFGAGSPTPSGPARRSAARSARGGSAFATLFASAPSAAKSVRTRPPPVGTP